MHGTHGPDYNKKYIDYSIFNWKDRKPDFFLEQVPHTYAYTLGMYAIQNEKQVSISESTCGAAFAAKPISAGGKAAFQMMPLTEVALERCDTARCAVELIGDLAYKFGVYGEDWKESPLEAMAEAGEALLISDPNEVW
jgi:dipeptidase